MFNSWLIQSPASPPATMPRVSVDGPMSIPSAKSEDSIISAKICFISGCSYPSLLGTSPL
jgi:hypothetical protein